MRTIEKLIKRGKIVERRVHRYIDKSPLGHPKYSLGYCHNILHLGYLNKRLIQEHQCLEKNCSCLERFDRGYWDELEIRKKEKEKIKLEKKKKQEAKKREQEIFESFCELITDIDDFEALDIRKEKDVYIIRCVRLANIHITRFLNEINQKINADIRLEFIQANNSKKREIIEKVQFERGNKCE